MSRIHPDRLMSRPAFGSSAVARVSATFSKDRTRTSLAGLLLVVNIVLLAVFLFTSYKGFFHSDSSVRNLLAQEMHNTGRFFPHGWNYVNKDLMLIFPHLIVWGLLFFFKSSYTLFAVTGVITALLVLGSLWWFTTLLGGERWQRLLTLAVLAGGVSIHFAEDMYGQAAYGVILALTCLLMMFGWKVITSIERPRQVYSFLLFALVVLVTWSNPQRSAPTYLLPLYTGLAAYLWGDGWQGRLRNAWPVIAITVAGFAVGIALSLWTLAHVNNIPGAGSARWLDFNGMVQNVVHTLHGLMGLLGGIPEANGNVVSRRGIYAALRLVGALVILVLIGRKVTHLCRDASPQARFVGGLVAGLALCFLFLQMTTSVPVMSDPLISARYLTPTVALGLMVLFASPIRQASWLHALLIVGLAVLLGSNSIVRTNTGSMINPGWKNPQREALVEQLKSMGLRYGYGSYWNAGVLTVLSDDQVKVRQVLIIDGLPTPMRHLSSEHWFDPEAWEGKSFLLLTDAEVAAINWGALARYVGQPIQQARIGDMQVFVFKQNLSLDLPGWSTHLRKPLRLEAAPDGTKTVGHWVDSQRALQSAPGEVGYLQYGPYMMLAAGHYRVTFDVSAKAADVNAAVGTVDVVSGEGQVAFATAEIHADGTGQKVLDFTLNKSVSNLEMRVLATGRGEVTYRGLTLSATP